MPIPFFLIGLGVASATAGLGKTVKAAKDQKDAKETNERAQSIVENATELTKECRDNSNKALNDLGTKKIWVLDQGIKPFIAAFEKLHDVELLNSAGLEELQKFKIDKQALEELKEMSAMASSILGSMAGGAALGAVTAFGAYGGAMMLGTCATTGTAIASLSGAAATNATLAFLGGGALSIGGLGIAGGTAVLGGLVAGPALAVMGFVIGAKASANKDAAYSNLAKAKECCEEMKTIRTLCKGIRMRAVMFERLLMRLDAIFEPLVYALEQIISLRGTDYSKYTDAEKGTVAACVAVASALKAVLDTPILNEDGTLTSESTMVHASTQKVIKEYAQ